MIGGDAGANEFVQGVNVVAAKQYPLFGVVSGDLAYGNAMNTCYRCWDSWLSLWENHMITSDNHIIPMLLPVGNHDVGSNDNSDAKQDMQNPCLYFQFFPQHRMLASDGSYLPSKVPPPDKRLTYFYHLFGNNTALISLDSAHVVPVHGIQDQFLDRILSSYMIRNRAIKIVTYHVPMYSSLGDWEGSTFGQQGRQYWVPLFDKYNVAAVFGIP